MQIMGQPSIVPALALILVITMQAPRTLIPILFRTHDQTLLTYFQANSTYQTCRHCVIMWTYARTYYQSEKRTVITCCVK